MAQSVVAENQRIAENIGRYGWHGLHVFPTDELHTRFTYSIGFAETYGQPEVMIFSLPRERAHSLLHECATVLKAGGRIEVGVEDDRILADNYKVVFRSVQAHAYPEYLGTARRYYGDRPFGAVVMFLPDKNHLFPWNDGYDDSDLGEALAIV
jgi:Domain of unknown function (DUF4262)